MENKKKKYLSIINEAVSRVTKKVKGLSNNAEKDVQVVAKSSAKPTKVSWRQKLTDFFSLQSKANDKNIAVEQSENKADVEVSSNTKDIDEYVKTIEKIHAAGYANDLYPENLYDIIAETKFLDFAKAIDFEGLAKFDEGLLGLEDKDEEQKKVTEETSKQATEEEIEEAVTAYVQQMEEMLNDAAYEDEIKEIERISEAEKIIDQIKQYKQENQELNDAVVADAPIMNEFYPNKKLRAPKTAIKQCQALVADILDEYANSTNADWSEDSALGYDSSFAKEQTDLSTTVAKVLKEAKGQEPTHSSLSMRIQNEIVLPIARAVDKFKASCEENQIMGRYTAGVPTEYFAALGERASDDINMTRKEKIELGKLVVKKAVATKLYNIIDKEAMQNTRPTGADGVDRDDKVLSSAQTSLEQFY